MHVVQRTNNPKYVYRRLVSYGHIQGLKGSCPISVCFYAVENAVLSMLNELKPEALLEASTDNGTSTLQAELDGIKARLDELAQSLTGSNRPVPQLLEAIQKLEARENDLTKMIEARKQEQALTDSKPLEQVQSILKHLEQQTDGEKHQCLMRLRTLVSSIVKRVEVEPIKISRQQTAFRAEIELKNSERRLIINVSGKTNYQTLASCLR